MASLQEQVGALVRYHRERADLTQSQLAERIDRQVGAISRIERGETAPTFKTLSSIAVALEIDVRDLFGVGPYASRGDRSDPLAQLFDRLSPLSKSELERIAAIVDAALGK